MATQGGHNVGARSLQTKDSPPERRPHSRTRKGCLTCRRRKVKCDEKEGPSCMNCLRLSLTCEHESQTRRAIQRSRRNKACQRCRDKKTRCASSSGSGPCDPCRRYGLECDLDTTGAGSGIPSTDESKMADLQPLSSIQNPLPEQRELFDLVNGYFAGPHQYGFYTFLHQPTIMNLLERGLVPEPLLLTICATSLKFVDPNNELADSWADQARRQLLEQVFLLPSLAFLQALLLLQRYEWIRGEHMSAWNLAGLAIRSAHALELNTEMEEDIEGASSTMSNTTREVRRRLMWCCFIMESQMEAGRKPLSRIDLLAIESKLPCEEESFQNGTTTNMPGLGMPGEDANILSPQAQQLIAERGGISAHLVTISVLRSQILKYTVQYHPRNQPGASIQPPWQANGAFNTHRKQLDEWYEALPEELDFDMDSLGDDRSNLISLMTTHCLFHSNYCDLFHVGSYLTASFESAPVVDLRSYPPERFLLYCRRGRLEHAFAIAILISAGMPFLTTEPDPIVAICACLAIRVLTTERRIDDCESLKISNDAVARVLENILKLVKRSASRCAPIKDLLFATSKQARIHGYPINLAGLGEPSSTFLVGDLSRSPSPSLRTYGTFGTIRNSLANNDAFASSPSALSDTGQMYAESQHSDEGILTTGMEFADIAAGSASLSAHQNLIFESHGWDDPGPSNQAQLQATSGFAEGGAATQPVDFDWTIQDLSLDPSDPHLYPRGE